jgi:hypothetical protein
MAATPPKRLDIHKPAKDGGQKKTRTAKLTGAVALPRLEDRLAVHDPQAAEFPAEKLTVDPVSPPARSAYYHAAQGATTVGNAREDAVAGQ